MIKVEGVQPCRLPPLPMAPAGSRLALLRQQREQRRQRARWLAGMLLAVGLAFVAQGFVREERGAGAALAKSRPVAEGSKARPTPPKAPLQSQAVMQPPARR